MNAIKTENLSKHYGTKIALDSLNLEIRKGEVYGFIGRNGAGKTTTINLILSLIHQTHGDIYINDEIVKFKNQDYKKVIGYVPDVPSYPKYMNAIDFLLYTADMYEVPFSKEKAIELLKFVDLLEPRKKISAYSRGMKQRLAIAQALVHDPEIIIMDEPTSALGPIGRKDVMGVIQKLKGEKTIFYSTHILEDVEKVCDRIGLLEKGELVLEDTIENIQTKYYNSKMLIETNLTSKELYEILIKRGFENNIEMNHKGIICDVEGKNTAQEILEYCMNENLQIKEFRRLNASLEDVFVRVTREKTT